MHALQTVDASMSLSGIASGQREKRFMIVRQYLKPLLMGSGPIMSMCTWRKRPSGAEKLVGSRRLCREIFDCWHSGHALHQSEISRRIDSYTYRLRMTRSVTFALGCAWFWKRWNTRFLREDGMVGRSASTVKSQYTDV